jgi:hypothetical protein
VSASPPPPRLLTWVFKLWQLLLQHKAQLTVQLTEVNLSKGFVKNLQQWMAQRTRGGVGRQVYKLQAPRVDNTASC